LPKAARAPKAARGGYHHGDLRRALIAGAREVLRRDGLPGLTLRAVARRAHVSHAAPYHHFADREELLEALAASGFDELRSFIGRHLAGAGVDGGLLLREAAVAYVLFAVSQPDLFRLMFGATLSGRPPSELLRDSSSAAYGLIHEGIAGALGEAGAGDPAAIETLARACWAMAHGIASLAIDGQFGTADAADAAAAADPEVVARETRALTEVLWHGLEASVQRVARGGGG
jgi:AcrR family transcriptional regulator